MDTIKQYLSRGKILEILENFAMYLMLFLESQNKLGFLKWKKINS